MSNKVDPDMGGDDEEEKPERVDLSKLHFREPEPDNSIVLPEDLDGVKSTIFYIIFLVIFTFISVWSRQGEMSYFFTQKNRELFVGAELDFQHSNFAKTYPDLVNNADFWGWLKGPGMGGLYQESWYNGADMSAAERGHVLHFNKLLGPARLRQLRGPKPASQTDGGCVNVPNGGWTGPEWRDHFAKTGCVQAFTYMGEDKAAYGPTDVKGEPTKAKWPEGMQKMDLKTGDMADIGGEEVSFTYSPWDDLTDTTPPPYYGLRATYGAGGHAWDLPTNYSVALEQINLLEKNKWIDDQTRVVFLDFNLYNPHINLFCVVRFVTEFSETGGVFPTPVFRTLKLYRYTTFEENLVMVFEIIFVLFVFWYLICELKECWSDGFCAYFSDGWNLLDMLNLIIFVIVIFMRIYGMLEIERMNVNPGSKAYLNLQDVAFIIQQERNLNAINGVLCWFKVFKYLEIFPKLAMLTNTLISARQDLILFLAVLMIVIIGFVLSFYLGFNSVLEDYSTMTHCLYTLLRQMFGDFDMDQLLEANFNVGFPLFGIYNVFVTIILSNIFVAIINTSYDNARAEVDSGKVRDVASVLFEAAKSRFNDMRAQEERLQKAAADLITSDADGDGDLDPSEIKDFLSKAGPGAKELIDKFDKNRDGELDETEMAEMREYLAMEREKMSAKMQEMIDKNGPDVLIADMTKMNATGELDTVVQEQFDVPTRLDDSVRRLNEVSDLLEKTAEENENSQTLINAVLSQQAEIQRALKKALQQTSAV